MPDARRHAALAAQGFRLLVFGGREYRDAAMIRSTLEALRPTVVIHGAARGADLLAGAWAKGAGIPVEEFPADWKRHGLMAGPIRNARMILKGKPDAALGFPGGSGSRDMARKALASGVPLLLSADWAFREEA